MVIWLTHRGQEWFIAVNKCALSVGTEEQIGGINVDVNAGIFQYAYFVEDIEASAIEFAKTLGAGPFFVAKHHKTDQFEYKGTPVEADVSYAFGYAGHCQIQLIQQHDQQPSIYRDMFGDGAYGLHHVARLEADYDGAKSALEAQGFEKACELFANDVWACYYDTRAKIHCYTEIHAITDSILATFERWRSAHANWDGKGDVIVTHGRGA